LWKQIPLPPEALSEGTMVACTQDMFRSDKFRSARLWIVTLAGILGMLANSPTAVAQENEKVKAGLQVWKKTGCADCHGSFANGEKQRDEAPTGADLRTARLDAAELKVVISCGKPGGAGMPAFDEGAYKVRACYGRPLGAPPDDLYPAGVTLTPAEIDAVIAYLQARIIGRGRITKQECLAYYDDRPDECDDIN
jgi:mono/diheme cytochrome c family protein